MSRPLSAIMGASETLEACPLIEEAWYSGQNEAYQKGYRAGRQDHDRCILDRIQFASFLRRKLGLDVDTCDAIMDQLVLKDVGAYKMGMKAGFKRALLYFKSRKGRI